MARGSEQDSLRVVGVAAGATAAGRRRSVRALLCAALLPVIAACALGRFADRSFQEWLTSAEPYCAQRYGAATFETAGERQEFFNGLYRAYYAPEYRLIFADRMGVRYPSNDVYIRCLVGRLPKPGFS
jgi:hypothetical protein